MPNHPTQDDQNSKSHLEQFRATPPQCQCIASSKREMQQLRAFPKRFSSEKFEITTPTEWPPAARTILPAQAKNAIVDSIKPTRKQADSPFRW
jgi:hypothetical protein